MLSGWHHQGARQSILLLVHGWAFKKAVWVVCGSPKTFGAYLPSSGQAVFCVVSVIRVAGSVPPASPHVSCVLGQCNQHPWDSLLITLLLARIEAHCGQIRACLAHCYTGGLFPWWSPLGPLSLSPPPGPFCPPPDVKIISWRGFHTFLGIKTTWNWFQHSFGGPFPSTHTR